MFWIALLYLLVLLVVLLIMYKNKKMPGDSRYGDDCYFNVVIISFFPLIIFFWVLILYALPNGKSDLIIKSAIIMVLSVFIIWLSIKLKDSVDRYYEIRRQYPYKGVKITYYSKYSGTEKEIVTSKYNECPACKENSSLSWAWEEIDSLSDSKGTITVYQCKACGHRVCCASRTW